MELDSTLDTAGLRDIPSVDALMRRASVTARLKEAARPVVLEAVRAAAEAVREALRQGCGVTSREELLSRFDRYFQQQWDTMNRPSLRGVINATGVILHTNLGRAPLAEVVVESIAAVARGYSNLEYDLVRGGRGARDSHCEYLLRDLLGCEASVVVNNNAAAVLLVLNTLADGGEVVISRGELIEIGGSFRIPDIMVKAGALLREVGTTNRTRLSDYQAAINDRTRLILRVHPSNFKMIGFSERPGLRALAELGHERGLPVFEDLGSGAFVDLREWNLPEEPLVRCSIEAGVDLCAFSGDKLLGGPQAGIISGRGDLVDRIRRNPWMRVVRPDKLTLSGLQATLGIYRQGLERTQLPVLRMIASPVEGIRHRARSFVKRARRALGSSMELELVNGFSAIGGGSAPDTRLATVLIAVRHPECSAQELERRLRAHEPPILCRIEDHRLVMDFRTVEHSVEPAILSCLAKISSGFSVDTR
ncbi:MAG: L-seryl-tRNA(Sec) selenium transferase [Acidobacteria bacterium]|nr:L-seryl-tRNA(Sec) selenium transferase [Acidobacteriota bacterium]